MEKVVAIILSGFLAVSLSGFLAVSLSAYNRQLVDMTYNYTYGYVELPNGECVERTVDSWTDYDNSDQIQVKIDGVTYFTNTTRVVLTTKK